MSILLVIPTWDMQRAAATATNFLSHDIEGIGDVAVKIVGDDGHKRMGVLEAMATVPPDASYDIIGFVHDDVEVYEDWVTPLVRVFEKDPQAGLVGFGGAKHFGSNDIYKTPYNLMQLIRYSFRSNMKDWAIHGTRIVVPERVSVLDGFSLFFRGEAYHKMGGWASAVADGMPPMHMYDAWAAARMAELGYTCWVCPVECHHAGGKTSTTQVYQEFVRAEGYESGEQVFEVAHRKVYDRFRGVLPIRAKENF